MSLDVTLTRTKWVSYEEGKPGEPEQESVYSANITHNLGVMAKEAGIYKALWRPEEIGKTKAKEIIDILEAGLADLKARPEHFKTFNAENGWGTYGDFIVFVDAYLDACKENPEATIEADR